jgi:lipopolysaccharide export system permease protein
MARLALFRTPAVAEQVLPFAILFGAMAALLQLSRKLELVVARAAGISAWQFLQPGILVAGLIGLVSVTVYNPLSAHLKQRAVETEARVFARTGVSVAARDTWIRQVAIDGQAIIRADNAIEQSTALLGVTIFTFDPGGAFQERIEAREAVLRDGYWELKDARVLSPSEEPQSYATYLLASNLDASQIRKTFTPPESVPFWDLNDTIAQTERAGLDATRYRLQYDILLARPLLFVAMVFVAAAFSLRFFRFGGVAGMVLSGVAAGFVLYVATQLMEDLGASGLVRPTVAAWFPAVVGTLLGTLALLHQEDG